jgi:hypothetical protein
VRPLKNLSLPPSQKKQFFYKNELAILLLASLIGTYLDLYFVGKGYYQFPQRLLPDIFPINIVFTLFILPAFTSFLISIVKNRTWLIRWSIFIITSFIIACIEKLSESYGLFSHSDNWRHYYSLIGYFLYMAFIWNFYKWIRK